MSRLRCASEPLNLQNEIAYAKQYENGLQIALHSSLFITTFKLNNRYLYTIHPAPIMCIVYV